ncbi:hypothetical protein HDU98_009299, partial [Podochytrium sp. JEL0797]
MSVLLLLGVILRVALVQRPDWTAGLADRIEVSTPVTSYKRMQEGVYLFRNNIDPYDGGVFHQPPLLLLLFHALPQAAIPYLLIAIDALCALLVHRIAETRRPKQFKTDPTDPTIPKDAPLSPRLVAAAFLLNPLSIATCMSLSTLPFNTFAVLASVYAATRGKRVYAMLCLSLAAYMTMYPVMLLLPCVLLLSSRPAADGNTKIQTNVPRVLFSCTLLFSTFLLAWLGLSNLLMGSWNFVSATYGVILLVPDLTPNIGLSWYIFIEMFDQFRLFFLLVFQVFVVAFCVPLSIKFREEPLFVVTLFLIITAAFKSYPSFGDIALYVPFVFMYQ